MRRQGLVVGLGLVMATSAWAASIEGTTWKVQLAPDAQAKAQGEKPGKDTLIFRKGQFTSTGCVRYGFKASNYTADQGQALVTWVSDQQSKRQGQMHWEGTVNKDAIRGTMSWKRPDGKLFNYTFSGKRKSS